MVKKLVALDLLNTILSKVYTKITNETNEKIEIATKEYADTFIPLTQKAAIKELLTTDDDINTLSSEYTDTIESE